MSVCQHFTSLQCSVFLARPTPTASPMSNPVAGAPAGSSAPAGHRPSFQPHHIYLFSCSLAVGSVCSGSALHISCEPHTKAAPSVHSWAPALCMWQKAATIFQEIWPVTVGTLHLSPKLSPGYLRSNVLQSIGFPGPCLPCCLVSQELLGLPVSTRSNKAYTPSMFH